MIIYSSHLLASLCEYKSCYPNMWQIALKTRSSSGVVVVPLVVHSNDQHQTTYVIKRSMLTSDDARTTIVPPHTTAERADVLAAVTVRVCNATERDARYMAGLGAFAPAVTVRLSSEGGLVYADGLVDPDGRNHVLRPSSPATFRDSRGTAISFRWIPRRYTLCDVRAGPVMSQFLRSFNRVGGRLENGPFTLATSFLVMPRLRETPSVMKALASSTPIVSVGYLHAVASRTTAMGPAVSPGAFIPPPIRGMELPPQLFRPRGGRDAVFRGLTFVFLKRDFYEIWRDIITAASGRAVLHDTRTATRNNPIEGGYSAPGVCVVRSKSELLPLTGLSPFQRGIVRSVHQAGARLVTRHEMACAMLLVSTEVACNPHVSATRFFEYVLERVYPRIGDGHRQRYRRRVAALPYVRESEQAGDVESDGEASDAESFDGVL